MSISPQSAQGDADLRHYWSVIERVKRLAASLAASPAARVRGQVVVSPRYPLGQTIEDEPAGVESP